jgi:hypothetical protein
MSRKVFIMTDGGHDYSDAGRFGELVFCTQEIIRKDDVAQMYRVMKAALIDATPDDYLLVGSLTTLCMVAASIMGDKFGELHLLLFKDGQYVARDLILDQS